jgi:hypothetical protein
VLIDRLVLVVISIKLYFILLLYYYICIYSILTQAHIAAPQRPCPAAAAQRRRPPPPGLVGVGGRLAAGWQRRTLCGCLCCVWLCVLNAYTYLKCGLRHSTYDASGMSCILSYNNAQRPSASGNSNSNNGDDDPKIQHPTSMPPHQTHHNTTSHLTSLRPPARPSALPLPPSQTTPTRSLPLCTSRVTRKCCWHV